MTHSAVNPLYQRPRQPALAPQPAAMPKLCVRYLPIAESLPLADNVLAAICFGQDRPAPQSPECIHLPLEVLHGHGLREVWQGTGPVRGGHDGAIRYRADAHYLFGVIEVAERDFADISAATRAVYAEIMAFQRRSGKPQLLRLWNYFDSITDGSGDGERYKQFCVGRVQGLGEQPLDLMPAATAIGRCHGTGVLQVYWLAGQSAGTSIENPRQLSAYLYPRQYGPEPPRFARATLTAAAQLLISGTSSIVGHATHHGGQWRAQLRETLTNVAALLDAAKQICPTFSTSLGPQSLLKVYLRRASDIASVLLELNETITGDVPLLVLHADICRDDLMIEMECVQSGAASSAA